MQHLDPDRLVLLALSEQPGETGESDHLAQCAACRHELDALRTVADLGAEGQELHDLPAPPEHLWRAIEADVARAKEGEAAPAPVIELAPQRARRRPRWLAPLTAAAAAAIIAVAGTVAVDRWTERPPAESITAQATLTPLPTVPATAGGSVRVRADGELEIGVRNLPLTTGFHQVWLIDPDDLTKMVSLGNLPNQPDAVLPVPPGIDLNRYRLVDVSDEPHDGNVAHSGQSLLRGTLTS